MPPVFSGNLPHTPQKEVPSQTIEECVKKCFGEDRNSNYTLISSFLEFTGYLPEAITAYMNSIPAPRATYDDTYDDAYDDHVGPNTPRSNSDSGSPTPSA